MDNHVNIQSLETLLWITRLGSFSAAARHLRLTQPAITRRVSELELQLGAPLFRRERPYATLTPAGRRCVKVAERIVADFAALKAAAGVSSGVTGTIRIGVSEVVALTWLDRLLFRINQKYAGVDIELDVDLSARLVKKLSSRNVDIAIVPGPVVLPGAVTSSLGSYGLSWMSCPDTFRLGRDIVPADLVDVPIIIPPQDAVVFSIMQDWFRESGLKPRRISFCGNLGVVATLVRKGVGVSLLPHNFLKAFIDEGTMIVLPSRSTIQSIEYNVAYLPTSELEFMDRIASFACDESAFFQNSF
jgi:DNA-binding transcriptional LysR family regulator